MDKVKLQVNAEDGSIKEEIELSFEEPELNLLRQFEANMNRLLGCELIKKGLPNITSFKWQEGEGFKFGYPKVEPRDVYELLHLARPLLLSREPASFERICTLFGKKVKGTSLTKDLKSVRYLYEKGEYQPYFQIKVNGVALFHETTLKNWLNGVEYHQDAEKRAQIKKLSKDLGEETARAIFMAQLSGKIKALYFLSKFVHLILKKYQQAAEY
jgi:hypothetical protein